MTGIDFHFTADQDNDAWQEESWTAHGGTHVPYEYFHPQAVSTCVYEDGQHVASGYHCPHYNGLDESGLKPGWTVLDK